MNPEKLLTAAASPEDREIIARALDIGKMVQKNHCSQVTDFYDPYRCGLLVRAVETNIDLAVRVDGGYAAAERSRVLICQDYMKDNYLDNDLSFLEVRGNFRFNKVTHRDYLGALLGLGLRREKLGDILVSEEGAQIIVASEVTGYITSMLISVGRVSVKVMEINREDLKPPAQNYRDIKVTVQSMRLDAIVAHGFGLSRSKMVREIAAGKINLNWRVCLDVSSAVQAGDIISARGRGRVEVLEICGQTKKGRVSLLLRRYGTGC